MKEFGARSNGAQKRNGGGYNEKTFRDLGSGFIIGLNLLNGRTKKKMVVVILIL